MERTFAALKPDAIKRGLIGKIISRIEDKGYKIVGMKLINVPLELASKRYEEHMGKPFYERLIKYITSGPIIAGLFEMGLPVDLKIVNEPKFAFFGIIFAIIAMTLSGVFCF